jgi:hypothetical protein
MSGAYDGHQVVGIDLHRRRSVLVRMTETGERLDAVRIDNDPMTLAAEIAKAGEHVGGSADVGGVVLGPVRCGLSPPRRGSRVTAGCEARGSSPRTPVPSGGYRRGEDRRGGCSAVLAAGRSPG